MTYRKRGKQNGKLSNLICDTLISSVKQILISNVVRLGVLEAQESKANYSKKVVWRIIVEFLDSCIIRN